MWKKKSECSEPLYITMKFNLLFQEVKHQIGSFPWSFHDNDRKFAFERNGYFFNCLQITLTHNDCNRNGNFCKKFKCKWKLYKKKKNIYIKDVPCVIKHSKKGCIDWLSFFSICVLLKRIYLNAMQTFTALDDWIIFICS